MSPLVQSRVHRAGQVLTVTLTTAIKLVGLAAAFKELFVAPQPHPVALAVSAFMMAGAQLSEEVLLGLLSRLLELGEKTEGPKDHGKPR